MDLATALMEFSELLEIAAKSMGSLMEQENKGAIALDAVEEVKHIAERLRDISEEVRKL